MGTPASVTTVDMSVEEPHPRVYPDVAQVADQVGDQADDSKDEKAAEYHRVVASDDRLVRQKPEAIEGEQRLDQERPGEECADEGRGESGHDRNQGVAKDVAPQHLALRHAFG